MFLKTVKSMLKQNNFLRKFLVLTGVSILTFGIVYLIIILINLPPLTLDDLYKECENKIKKVNNFRIYNLPSPDKDKQGSLPNIFIHPAQVNDSVIQIFSSEEKTGENGNGWLSKAVNDFNSSSENEINGKAFRIELRGIASGMAADYIESGKYIPDVFMPSNELWGNIINSKGQKMSLLEQRLLGNVAGIVLDKDKNDAIVKEYNGINAKTIAQAVMDGRITIGYSDPFASSTGLNFLVSTLYGFDNNDLVSDKASQQLGNFLKYAQNPFFTTLQMQNSSKNKRCDCFIMEYQTYLNFKLKNSDYMFEPFGVRHDNPVYISKELSDTKKAALLNFIKFCKSSKYEHLATEYGFNNFNNYKSEIKTEGCNVPKIQELWKEKRNDSSIVNAIFVADISASMNYNNGTNMTKLDKLKKSLATASKYIGPGNSIGLVTFSKNIYINLPITKFDTSSRSKFLDAVGGIYSEGRTAMYDGIIVAAKLLVDKKIEDKDPNKRYIMFVLSDGESNEGHDLKSVKHALKESGIPICTINYDTKINELQTLSEINEAPNIFADERDIVYKLSRLLESQM